MIAFGTRWDQGSPVHRLRQDWPRRFVVTRTDKGWNTCDQCDREHRVWVTDDEEWSKLPRSRRGFRLCVGCFRRLVRGKAFCPEKKGGAR